MAANKAAINTRKKVNFLMAVPFPFFPKEIFRYYTT